MGPDRSIFEWFGFRFLRLICREPDGLGTVNDLGLGSKLSHHGTGLAISPVGVSPHSNYESVSHELYERA